MLSVRRLLYIKVMITYPFDIILSILVILICLLSFFEICTFVLFLFGQMHDYTHTICVLAKNAFAAQLTLFLKKLSIKNIICTSIKTQMKVFAISIWNDNELNKISWLKAFIFKVVFFLHALLNSSYNMTLMKSNIKCICALACGFDVKEI